MEKKDHVSWRHTHEKNSKHLLEMLHRQFSYKISMYSTHTNYPSLVFSILAGIARHLNLQVPALK